MCDVAIMVAPNGARRTRKDHPRLPVTAAEIGATALACRRAGAGAIHVHVRDGAGKHSLDPAAYRAAIAEIRAQAGDDMAIQVTTESAGVFGLSEQIGLVRSLRPAAISFSIRELMREGQQTGEAFLAWAGEQGIAIQFIVYDAGEIAGFADLWRTGKLHLSGRPRIIIVVGRYSKTQDSTLADFDELFHALTIAGLAERAIWMTCAFGRGELACLERSIELGGHVRVGFENAIVDANGQPARDNAERVAMVAGLAARHGRAVASAQRSGELLGLRSLDALL